jgi:aminopeptidase N
VTAPADWQVISTTRETNVAPAGDLQALDLPEDQETEPV